MLRVDEGGEGKEGRGGCDGKGKEGRGTREELVFGRFPVNN